MNKRRSRGRRYAGPSRGRALWLIVPVCLVAALAVVAIKLDWFGGNAGADVAALAPTATLADGHVGDATGVPATPDAAQGQPEPTTTTTPSDEATAPVEATETPAALSTPLPTAVPAEEPKQTSAAPANPLEAPKALAGSAATAAATSAVALVTSTPAAATTAPTINVAAPTTTPVASPSPSPTAALPLSGVKVGIDPGHQSHANSSKEAIAPGSKTTKAKVSSGTAGVKTRVAEYKVNLIVALMLRDALEAQGATVYMTRETNDVDVSNIERAQMMNDAGVDIVLRIHCNGNNDRSANGIGLYIRKTGEGADECERAAEALLPAMVAATGAEQTGIHKSDTYTGLNWSTVPSILVEMGYMSNPDEDVKLNDPEYQAKMVQGMVEGVAKFMGRTLPGMEELAPIATGEVDDSAGD